MCVSFDAYERDAPMVLAIHNWHSNVKKQERKAIILK